MNCTLPIDSNARKDIPLRRGCARYFPAALMLVAITSKKGNDKHNPGQDLHHARGKSSDHADCIDRHLSDIDDLVALWERNGSAPDDWKNRLREELGSLAWRALALVQELSEKYLDAPLAPAAKLPQSEPVERPVPKETVRCVPLHQLKTGECICGDPNCTWPLPRARAGAGPEPC